MAQIIKVRARETRKGQVKRMRKRPVYAPKREGGKRKTEHGGGVGFLNTEDAEGTEVGAADPIKVSYVS